MRRQRVEARIQSGDDAEATKPLSLVGQATPVTLNETMTSQLQIARKTDRELPVRQPIMIVGNFLSSSIGNRQVCEDLAVRLQTEGWPVLTTSCKRNRLSRLRDTLRAIWRQRRRYAAAQVDVFSGPGFLLSEAACLTLRLAGKPYILTLHGGGLPAFARRWPARVRRLLGSAFAVTAPSNYLLEQMRAYRTDVCLLPNPLDLDQYEFQQRGRLRPRLVWLRAFSEMYNPSLAPRVVSLLAGEFPDIHLDMIGPDKGDGSLQAMQKTAAALGVADRIATPGAIPKSAISRWLNRGDIFLNTTNVDNTPVSVLEAMACGLCVVSTDVGGMTYLVRHEASGLLTPPGDAAAMAAAVRRLLRDPAMAAKISAGAREQAKECDWSLVLPQWEHLLRAAAGNDLSREAR